MTAFFPLMALLNRKQWCCPVVITSSEIAAFPITDSNTDDPALEPFIHLFNVQEKSLQRDWIQYPPSFRTGFSPNDKYIFCYIKEKKEIMIVSDISIVYGINVNTKQWTIYGSLRNVSEHILHAWSNKNNQIECVAVEYPKSGALEVASLYHFIFHAEKNKFESIKRNNDPILKDIWWHNQRVAVSKKSHAIFIVAASCMNIKSWQSDGNLTHFSQQNNNNNAYNGILFINRDNIILGFNQSPRVNEKQPLFIHIVKMRSSPSIIKQSTITCDDSWDPIHVVLIEDLSKEELLVHGYCNNNNNQPTLPFAVLQMVQDYYSNQYILFLKKCETVWTWDIVELDDVLNDDPPVIKIQFKCIK